MKTANNASRSLLFFICMTLSILPLAHAAMNDYCITPPFIVSGVKPNLLIMFDNSASMYDPYYISATQEYCYDNSYNNATTYVGNFDSTKSYTSAGVQYKYYCSNATTTGCTKDADCPVGGQCVPKDSFTTSQFSEYSGAWPPAGCTYRTNYLCVTTNEAVTPVTVNQFVAKGNFLNWLSASKLDIQKKFLTGGKFDAVNNVLVGETRGCVGKRFVKEVPAADWIAKGTKGITFGVRGLILEPYEPSIGDVTRIDIFSGDFNFTDCNLAIKEWNCAVGGGTGCSYGQAQKYTESCMVESAGSKGKKVEPAYNHALQTCWMYFKHGQLPGTGDIQRIQNACELIYIQEGIDPAAMPEEYYKANVCVKDASLKDFSDPTDPGGYVGMCWKDNATKWIGVPSGVTPEVCIARELLDYCQRVKIGEVVDPSEGSVGSDELWNIPAFLIDSGVMSQIGDPVWTYHARVQQNTAPTGLIQKYYDLIRFGVMEFNTYGSTAECTLPGSTVILTCTEPTNKDGGRIIHHIGDPETDLIAAVNGIQAKTWTPFAEGFYTAINYFGNKTNTELVMLNSTDFDDTKPPVQYSCQKNNILLVTDGMSTADLNSSINDLVSTSGYNDGDGQINTSILICPKYAGSMNVDDLSWLAKNRNIKDFTRTPDTNSINSQTITTYVVYNGAASNETNECNPVILMQETAENGGTTLKTPTNPTDLYNELDAAFQKISGAAASGTAASVLATGEGSGANLIQALFYPELIVGGTKVTWSGSLKNMWYFIDPRLGNSSIRADSDSDRELELTNDDIVHFRFDQADNITKADLYRDADGDGIKDTLLPYSSVYFENVKSIWEASGQLWSTSPGDRMIYTTTDGARRELFNTPLTDTSPLISLLQAGTNKPLAERIISYVRGTDYNNKFCSSTVSTACTVTTDCPAGEQCINYRNRTVTISGSSNTLKLGDIINSTPRIASWVPLNTYYETYKDKTYKEFTQRFTYTDRGTVFVGANDGMLHAFYLGKLSLFDEKNKKASITDPDGIGLGKEQWAFIPKNMLPYLRYMADTSYCHLYYVDATPYLFDASIASPSGCSGSYWDCIKTADSWKTVLIGSMRFGGACKDPTDSNADGRADSCTKDLNQNFSVTNDDCVITPSSGVGYSSYFALDITNPANPQVMWEFSHPDMGYSSSGPAVVRIGDKAKNGRWFVVIGSGPTGPIDKNTHQMKGFSDQNLKVFILDLKGPSSGTWTLGTNYWVKDSGIENAFSGSMINAPIDLDQNNPASTSYYQDDALYFGYVKAEVDPILTTTKWNVGGVLRLLTKNNLTDPGSQWALSRVVKPIDGTAVIGPVTSAVAKLQNYSTGKLYLFFGAGRYYYKAGDNIDDPTNVRSLYGVVEPCYSSSGLNTTCIDDISRTDLGDADDGAASDDNGWYITLDPCTDAYANPVPCTSSSAIYKTERNVTDPLATTIGAVFFTTTKPSANVCEFGGASHLWAVQYDTGGCVSSKLRGRALMQVSTGSIEEVDLKTAFTNSQSRGNRRASLIQGVPPAGTPPGIILPAKPMNKILHIREQ